MLLKTISVPTKRRLSLRRLVQLAVAAAAIFTAVSLYISSKLPATNDPVTKLLAAGPSRQFCARVRSSHLPNPPNKPLTWQVVGHPPQKQPPLVCAHGGDTASAPPNTEAAFENALRLGASCMEIDVARTKDDQLVVLHTRELALRGTLKRHAATQREQAGDFTWQELQQLRWPGGQGVMLAEAAVQLTSPAVTTVVLDLKPYLDQDGTPLDKAHLAELVVALLQRTGCPNCLVFAKSDSLVASVKRLRPAQPCGYVLLQTSPEARRLGLDKPFRLAASMQVLGAYHKLASPQLLEQAHRRGLELLVWTVNSPGAIQAALELGVDAIVTNEPELVLRAIENMAVACRAGKGKGLEEDGL